MAAKESDRRVLRTRQLVRDALIALMVERGYEKVTVQHILDRAGVGRSTFYVHFRDKEDVLRSSIDNLRAALIHHWKARLAMEAKPLGALGFASHFFRHVGSSRQLYRAIVGRESGVIVNKHFRRILGDMVRMDLADRAGKGRRSAEFEAVVQHVVGALMSLMTWWMDYNPALSADQIDSIFLRMTLPGLDAVLPGKYSPSEHG